MEVAQALRNSYIFNLRFKLYFKPVLVLKLESGTGTWSSNTLFVLLIPHIDEYLRLLEMTAGIQVEGESFFFHCYLIVYTKTLFLDMMWFDIKWGNSKKNF